MARVNQITCKCGKSFRPYFRNGIITSKLCPNCQYKKLLKKPPKKKAETKRKPRTFWKDKDTKDLITHIQDYICNPYIRERDKTLFGKSISDNGSISDAGHYYPRGRCSGMRFRVDNIHGQSRSGNSFKGGDQLNYRKGLISRHGLDYVERLERAEQLYKSNSFKFDRHDLLLIGETFKHLHKNKIWVFEQSEFDRIKLELFKNKQI